MTQKHSALPAAAKKRKSRMDNKSLTISAFQKHISDKYEKVDRERGSAKTFLWFIEEVGELATALNGDDRANLNEEFADVLAWLCTLANINNVDLSSAVVGKYLGDQGPQGHK
jgi:NTP pyrophosphatase (non-canonical NTP hydrolase)